MRKSWRLILALITCMCFLVGTTGYICMLYQFINDKTTPMPSILYLIPFWGRIAICFIVPFGMLFSALWVDFEIHGKYIKKKHRHRHHHRIWH